MSSLPHRDHTADLTRLVRMAEQLGSRDTARDARDLAARVAGGRFFLATVGQFKRGKSTLLNALLGEPLLPTGVAPVTSAITVIRFGQDRSARVIFKDGGSSNIRVDELSLFVTEGGNPKNEKNVAAVEIFHPASLLAKGMCLVDTPGLGSVFEANTEETRAFVPHIDAALVVLGADPPISADELALVDEVGREVDQLVFVLNKADKLTPADLGEARRFTEGILKRQLNRPNERLYETSATERLAEGATRNWMALESRLEELASRTSVVVEQSARRGVARIARRLSHEIDELHDALTRPVEESQRRIAHLDTSVQHATQLLRDLAALFCSEEERIIREFFDTAQDRFVAANRAHLSAELRAAIEALAMTQRRGALRQASFAAAREIVRRRIGMWLTEVEPQAELHYRQATRRFVELANGFLTSLRASHDSSFEHLPESLEPEAGFRAPQHFYFTDLMHLTAVGPGVWLFDHILTRAGAVDAIGRHATRYAERLLTSNCSRVTFDLRDRLTESRRALESELRFMLKEITASATRAVKQAREVRERGEAAIADELQRLAQHRATLRELSGERDADGHDA